MNAVPAVAAYIWKVTLQLDITLVIHQQLTRPRARDIAKITLDKITSGTVYVR